MNDKRSHEPNPKFSIDTSYCRYTVCLRPPDEMYSAPVKVCLCLHCGCLYPTLSDHDAEFYDGPDCPAR